MHIPKLTATLTSPRGYYCADVAAAVWNLTDKVHDVGVWNLTDKAHDEAGEKVQGLKDAASAVWNLTNGVHDAAGVKVEGLKDKLHKLTSSPAASTSGMPTDGMTLQGVCDLEARPLSCDLHARVRSTAEQLAGAPYLSRAAACIHRRPSNHRAGCARMPQASTGPCLHGQCHLGLNPSKTNG